MSLFDLIKGNMQQAPKPPQASEMNQTGQVQSLLAAKSGKAAGPSAAPRISNIGEQQVEAQAAAGAEQMGRQAQLAAAEVGQKAEGQAQAIQQQQSEMTEKEESIQDEFNRNHTAILDQYSQGKQTLDLSKDKSKFEQIGFNLRLQNDQYIDKLQREGARSRLDNDAKFQQELARTTFADEEDMFRDNLQFRSMLGADNRNFMDDLANVDLDFALGMAKQSNAQANQQTMWSGVGGLVSGGAQAYGNSKSSGDDDSAINEFQDDGEG